jgi:hypothetical protein
MSGCPFHRMLRHLKVFAGLPVPETVKWIDGKPDFRQIDENKLDRAIKLKLCAVCGKKLGFNCYWIGGPNCKVNHFFLDSAMHRECAEESARLCPFLNGTRRHYREELTPHPMQDISGRPTSNFIMRGVTAAMEVRPLGKEFALYAGDHLTVIKEF